MLHALLHGLIDTGDIEIVPIMADVEALNLMAADNTLEVSKISFYAWAHLLPCYQMLQSGAALGQACGPLLIAKKRIPNEAETINALRIALPGAHTTAHFLFQYAFPQAQHKVHLLFSQIETAVTNGTADAGVIIHENRFTYAQKGLHNIMDLGQYWETKTALPIPLGGIAVQRSLPESLKTKLNTWIGQSVAIAMAQPALSHHYVLQHAAEMDLNVVQQHIQLYVNPFSISLGREGKKAVEMLLEIIHGKQVFEQTAFRPIFVD